MEYFQREIVFLFYIHTPPPLQQLFVLVWHLKQISVAADLLKAVPVPHIVVLTISPCAGMVRRSLFPKHQCPSDSCSWLNQFHACIIPGITISLLQDVHPFSLSCPFIVIVE